MELTLNLIDSSNIINANYSGQFGNVNTEIISANNNFSDIKENTNETDKKRIIDKLVSLFDNYLHNESIADFLKMLDLRVHIYPNIQNKNGQSNENSIKHTNMGDYIQIGDRIEITQTGNYASNYFERASMDNKTQRINELQSKIEYLEVIIKDKDELIFSLKEIINLLKKNQ